MPQYKAKVIIKMLEECGYFEVSVRGDHHKYKDLNGHTIIVPYSSRNSSIAVGTYRAIIRQINNTI